MGLRNPFGGSSDLATKLAVDAILADPGDVVIDYASAAGVAGVRVVKASDTQQNFVNNTGVDITLTGESAAALVADGLNVLTSSLTTTFLSDAAVAPGVAGEPSAAELTAALGGAKCNAITKRHIGGRHNRAALARTPQ